jgi:hypothetical protein
LYISVIIKIITTIIIIIITNISNITTIRIIFNIFEVFLIKRLKVYFLIIQIYLIHIIKLKTSRITALIKNTIGLLNFKQILSIIHRTAHINKKLSKIFRKVKLIIIQINKEVNILSFLKNAFIFNKIDTLVNRINKRKRCF